jgi:hypothetical protein
MLSISVSLNTILITKISAVEISIVAGAFIVYTIVELVVDVQEYIYRSVD